MKELNQLHGAVEIIIQRDEKGIFASVHGVKEEISGKEKVAEFLEELAKSIREGE